MIGDRRKDTAVEMTKKAVEKKTKEKKEIKRQEVKIMEHRNKHKSRRQVFL